MNLLHLKYALEIAGTHSISKAAENLYMGQPNLSRAIKELEENLGIIIFNRTSKGITVTLEGEQFLHYARRIILQVDEVEKLYKSQKAYRHRFSVCAPRASYISVALTEFAKRLDSESVNEIYYKETNSLHAVNDVVNEQSNLAIVRYRSDFEKHFQNLFEDKKLENETLCEFSFVLLISRKNQLCNIDKITLSSLTEMTEITHADKYVPSVSLNDLKKAELSDIAKNHIYIYERGSQFELLEKVANSFMWVSPVPQQLCDKYSLVQRTCADSTGNYKDVLLYRKGYRLTDLDAAFINEVKKAGGKYLSCSFQKYGSKHLQHNNKKYT